MDDPGGTPSGDYATFRQDSPHPWCWNCGRGENDAPWYYAATFCLERAHIGAGSGSMRREEDVRGVVILCSLCHRRHRSTGGTLRMYGQSLQAITPGILLWLKQVYDPSRYDVDYIRRVWTGEPPEPREPWLVDEVEYQRHRGFRPGHWSRTGR